MRLPGSIVTSAQRSASRSASRSATAVVRHGILGYLATVAWRGRLTTPELAVMRVAGDRLISRLYPDDPVAGVEVTPVRATVADGQVRGEWVEAPGTATRQDAVLLYLHGGGFVFGSPSTHRSLTSELSRRLGRSVFSVDYRLAPRHVFPAAADDVLRAYRRLLDSGVPADRIVVAGDSAGGHLALGLPPRAHRAGLTVPAGVVAFSPATDPSFAVAASLPPDPMVPTGAAVAVVGAYARRASGPEVRLLEDDLALMPPTLVQAADGEFCEPDARAYVDALRAAGGDVRYETWARAYHVFQFAHARSRKAKEALDRVEAFVGEVAPLGPVHPA